MRAFIYPVAKIDGGFEGVMMSSVKSWINQVEHHFVHICVAILFLEA